MKARCDYCEKDFDTDYEGVLCLVCLKSLCANCNDERCPLCGAELEPMPERIDK